MKSIFPKPLHVFAIVLACLSSTWMFAQTSVPAIPEIPAFLPLSHTVAASNEAMPLDGVWNITNINKRIRIERGRAYAVDSWLHLFVLRIQPNMVVTKDIARTGPGTYSGYDLPLAGPATYTANSNGTLDLSVQGLLGPVKLLLAPVQLDDRSWFERDRMGESDRDDNDDDDWDEESGEDGSPDDEDDWEDDEDAWG